MSKQQLKEEVKKELLKSTTLTKICVELNAEGYFITYPALRNRILQNSDWLKTDAYQRAIKKITGVDNVF